MYMQAPVPFVGRGSFGVVILNMPTVAHGQHSQRYLLAGHGCKLREATRLKTLQ